MIDYDVAIEMAENYISGSEVPVRLTRQGKFSEGWYFCFDSIAYLDTGNLSERLAGNGPFLIDKDTGELHVLGTSKPLAVYLSEYVESKSRRNL